MYILYDLDSCNVLDVAEYIQSDDEYFTVCRDGLKVKYHNKGLGVFVLADQDIIRKDKAPLVFDLEQGLVYPDPFFIEEENDDVNDDIEDGAAAERPMTASEMRTRIKKLEDQFSTISSILNVIVDKMGVNLNIIE